MVFSSYTFLFLFLPAVCIVYFILPFKLKNIWLLLASLFFYGWNRPEFTLILLASIAINWTCALIIEYSHRKKPALIVGIILNLSLLVYFKYANFIVGNLSRVSPGIADNWTAVALPLGISFFTFQGMSYIVDVYRGDGKALRNPLDAGLYVALFPQLVAGPIVRFKDIAAEIKSRKVSYYDIGYGFRRFVYGLSKKVLLADTFGLIADKVFVNPSLWDLGGTWIGILAYTLQIYYDFSGYSDMAIGLGSIFGFHFNENFDYPYSSRSIREFWRRWHISLSTWFRDYAYIPCGGSRVGLGRHIFNIMLVWLLTGFWHGANWTFVLWGIYYGALLLAEKYIIGDRTKKVFEPLCWIITLLLVMVGWVIFRSDSVYDAARYLAAMFRPEPTHEGYIFFMRNLSNYIVFWIAGVIGIFPVKKLVQKAFDRIGASDGIIRAVLENAYALVLFAASVIFIVSGSYNAFIYFQF